MKQDSKIICLGDSLTYGYPYGPQDSWVTYAAMRCGLELVNAGVNGNTVEDMARRFPDDVRKKHPSAVIILGGTNDAYWGEVSHAQTVYFLEGMIQDALKHRIQPIIGLPIPVDEPFVAAKLERICTSYRKIAERFGLLQLNFAPSFLDRVTGGIRDELYLDGVHPNRAGYRAMGEIALDFFNNYFLQR